MQKQKFDEIVSYFNKKVSEMEIETKYKMELLGMVTALGYAHEKETHEKRTETHACDLISRADVCEILSDIYPTDGEKVVRTKCIDTAYDVALQLPTAQPEIKPIDYQDCANAMMKMWIDNVLTDGEYNRIMDKLNKHWGKGR